MDLFILALVDACANDRVGVVRCRAEQVGILVALAFSVRADVFVICHAGVTYRADQGCLFDDCGKAHIT